MNDRSSRASAQIVCQLDAAIAAFRAGQVTGMQALDTGRGLMEDLADDAIARACRRRRVPSRPDQVEVAILTALADTYGAELLTNVSLGYALRLVARHGGVTLVQRLLLGETATDRQLAVMLTACRSAVSQIMFVWPDVFLAEANAVLARWRLGPPSLSDAG